MYESLNHLDRVYGGVISYIQNIGLTNDQIDTLKQKLLEPSEKYKAI
ncbi:MAG: hypothetical protein CBB61_003015 [Gammaproteobacteria bacterium TMED1]|nr:MAG: hypothetical protein CBB61_003015 [Gammaproteobacteria bacterium TMED1]|tara:strand:- start:449 stop:589 length:141 start_codon:yes stop_codon:yes gene_type:complete